MFRVLKAIGRKLRKNGPGEQAWYAFGAAGASYFVSNNILPQGWTLTGNITPAMIGDVIAGGLVAAGVYEFQMHVVPKILAWLSRSK